MSEPLPETSPDGLQLVHDTKMDAVYRLPAADFSDYKAIELDSCTVAFRKNWMRDQNDYRLDLTSMVTKKDMERIQTKLVTSCDEHFAKAFDGDSHFTLVDSSTESELTTLKVKPSIVNLDITAPDTLSAGMRRSYTTSAGEMTLILEVYDATTGAILARVADRQQDPDDFNLEWTNSATNSQTANRIFNHWTSLLKEGLDEAVSGT